jgi:hypothetical protein
LIRPVVLCAEELIHQPEWLCHIQAGARVTALWQSGQHVSKSLQLQRYEAARGDGHQTGPGESVAAAAAGRVKE